LICNYLPIVDYASMLVLTPGSCLLSLFQHIGILRYFHYSIKSQVSGIKYDYLLILLLDTHYLLLKAGRCLWPGLSTHTAQGISHKAGIRFYPYRGITIFATKSWDTSVFFGIFWFVFGVPLSNS